MGDVTGNAIGTWLMRESDIKGLNDEQIRDKFPLLNAPTGVLPVNIPSGQKIQASTASSVLGNNGGVACSLS